MSQTVNLTLQPDMFFFFFFSFEVDNSLRLPEKLQQHLFAAIISSFFGQEMKIVCSSNSNVNGADCAMLQMKYVKPLKLYQELLKSSELKKSRLLGLDVGDKYVGLSVSDANNKTASPLRSMLTGLSVS